MPEVKPDKSGGYVRVKESHRAYEGGNFLIVVVRVDEYVQHLSMDLLNHFIIVQDVFMSEVKQVSAPRLIAATHQTTKFLLFFVFFCYSNRPA